MSIETIGIVGGGQLGRMLTEAAIRMGYRVNSLEEGVNCPAAQVGAHQIEGSIKDAAAITELARISDVVTPEIEHVAVEALIDAEFAGIDVQPSPGILRIIMDKYRQKSLFKRAGLPVADFMNLPNDESLGAAFEEFGAVMLKTRFGGYDGRGNRLVQERIDPVALPAFLQDFVKVDKLADANLYAERAVEIDKELSVIFARDRRGNIVNYPVTEMINKESQLSIAIAPARVDEAVAETAVEVGRRTMSLLKGAGVIVVEMILTKDGEVLVNEVAPRVHNSGHWTIEGSPTSQFKQHIRAITGMELGFTARMKHPAVVMVNILGERGPVPAEPKGIEEAQNKEDAHVHIYGKEETKPARKMGHLTVVGDDIDEVLERGKRARQLVSI